MPYRDVFVAVEAFKVFAYVRLLIVFCSTSEPVPSVSILGTRKENPRDLSCPSAKGGEGAVGVWVSCEGPIGARESFGVEIF